MEVFESSVGFFPISLPLYTLQMVASAQSQQKTTVIQIQKVAQSSVSNGNDSTKRENEIAILESQLTASIRLQIENIRAGISQMDLMVSETLPRALPAQLASIVGLCDETDAMISNYNFIKMVSRTHANFQQTRAIYDQFRVLDEQIDRVSGLLQADSEAESVDNLLLIYCRLAQLTAFKENALEMVKTSSSSLVYQLKRYFKKLDDLSEAFDAFYWKLPKDLQEADRFSSSDLVKISLVLSRMADANKSRFLDIIDSSVTRKFDSSLPILSQKKTTTSNNNTTTTKSNANAGDALDFDKVLEEISFYSNDLLHVRDRLSPRFAPSLGLLDFYILAYHRNIHRILACLFASVKATPPSSTTGLTAGQILSVLGWVKRYYEAVEGHFGISPDDLEPRLMDDREGALIADYTRLSRKKITEWIGNLLSSETRYFTERKAPPDADGDDRFFTPATVDLFQIVKQHIDMAAGVSSGRLLADIVTECIANISTFQGGLLRVVERESRKFLERPEQAAPYFEDYVIMMGNSSLRWIENMQNLAALMEEPGSSDETSNETGCLLKPEFLGPVQKQFKTASEGFLRIAKASTQTLVEIITTAIKTCCSQLFALEWYSETLTVVQTITATYDDFFSDYQQHAEEFLMVKLVADVLERTVILYIEALRSRNARLRMQQQAAEESSKTTDLLLLKDTQTLQNFFSRFRDPKKVEKALDPLVKLRTLLMASEKMIFLEFFALVKAYPDISIDLVEELLAKRDDIDKSALKDLIEPIRSKLLHEDKHIETTNTSIFSKLKPSHLKVNK